MKPEGVLDELGFLALSGVLAERMYPRLSTIMTRARYFIFVPAICQSVERGSKSVRQNAESVARRLQVSLCLELMKTSSNEPGVIGRRTKGDVVRPPSSIYWNSLNDLQIGTSGQSEADYYRGLAAASAAAPASYDDGVVFETDGADSGHFNPKHPTDGIVTKHGAIEPGLSLRMTAKEAAHLREMMLDQEKAAPLSLLGFRLERISKEKSWSKPPHSWNMSGLPSELERVANHAKCLSLLARGAQLQYHAMLFEKRFDLQDGGTRPAFDAWWSSAKAELSYWDVKDFRVLIDDSRRHKGMAQLPLHNFGFLQEWRDCVLKARNSGAAYEDEHARMLLSNRETRMRSVKARLHSASMSQPNSYLQEWKPADKYDPHEIYGLDFRHRVGNAIVSDIAHGLENGK